MNANPPTSGRKNAIVLTTGSKVRVRSANSQTEALVSAGTFRGLVSIGGDSSLAVEMDDSAGADRGKTRLIPINAVLAIDVLEAAKPEEEKRVDTASPGYFG
jgi:hypothetical protein